ncbi:hypothetical protein S245_008635 [Arachis hypogaea]
MDESEDESLQSPSVAGILDSHKYLITGIVKDVLQEFVSMTTQIVKFSKKTRKIAIQNEKSLLKSHDRVAVLLKHLDSLDEDQAHFNKEEDFLESEEEESDA